MRGVAPNCHFVVVDNLPDNSKPELDDYIWNEIYAGMRAAIVEGNGTGKKSDPKIEGLKIYGKTGTAENPHGDNHAWYAGWCEYKNEKFSLVILLENAGSGGSVAAPIAKEIFNRLFRKNLLVNK